MSPANDLRVREFCSLLLQHTIYDRCISPLFVAACAYLSRLTDSPIRLIIHQKAILFSVNLSKPLFVRFSPFSCRSCFAMILSICLCVCLCGCLWRLSASVRVCRCCWRKSQSVGGVYRSLSVAYVAVCRWRDRSLSPPSLAVSPQTITRRVRSPLVRSPSPSHCCPNSYSLKEHFATPQPIDPLPLQGTGGGPGQSTARLALVSPPFSHHYCHAISSDVVAISAQTRASLLDVRERSLAWRSLVFISQVWSCLAKF